MGNRIPLSRHDLEDHLEEQLSFLQASADAYDRGLHGEAKRLAVNLRVLFHDSKSSKSLLRQLDRLGGRFLSTAFPQMPGNLSSHYGLAMIGMKGQETRYLAMLDDVPFENWLPFSDWWSEVVIVDNARREVTRRDLVLVAANQDGGAHVDATLNAIYHDLARRNSLGWVYSDGTKQQPIPIPERAAVRQIAHEALRSVLPDYRRKPDHTVDLLAGPVGLFDQASPPALPGRQVPGRNDPCPCGGGKKYKRCHGKLTG